MSKPQKTAIVDTLRCNEYLVDHLSTGGKRAYCITLKTPTLITSQSSCWYISINWGSFLGLGTILLGTLFRGVLYYLSKSNKKNSYSWYLVIQGQLEQLHLVVDELPEVGDWMVAASKHTFTWSCNVEGNNRSSDCRTSPATSKKTTTLE